MEDKEIVNFMSSNPLNRFSWLRSSTTFVNKVATHPQAKWLLFKRGDPLVDVTTGNPVRLSTQRLEPILGKQPYFGQGSPSVKECDWIVFFSQKSTHLGINQFNPRACVVVLMT